MSKTKIAKSDPLNPDAALIQEAAGVLKRGGLVILPTETVYGIAANMLDSKAVERLYKIKHRPKDKLFSVHLADKEKIEEFAVRVPPVAYKLVSKFWPGPLTLILNVASEGTIGLRMPDNQLCLKVIAASGVPVVMPSANLSARPAALTFEEAIRDMKGLVELAIDGGRTKLGQESTIVDLTAAELKIIREGALGREEIEKAAGTKNVLFVCTGNSCRSVMAEAYLKKLLEKSGRNDVTVYSAGVSAISGMPPTQETQDVLRQQGIDVASHSSQRLTRQLIRQSDLVLVMEKVHEQRVLEIAPEAKNRLFLLKEFAKINDHDLNVGDPIGRPRDYYEQTFNTIKQAVERIADII